MGALWGRIQRLIQVVRQRGREVIGGGRERWPWLDHLVRAYQRYTDRKGDHLAGSVAYFAFLGFFPLMALTFSVAGALVTYVHSANRWAEAAVRTQLPELGPQLLTQLQNAKLGAGVIGLVGVLYAGLGWLGALRISLRRIWLHAEPEPNPVLARLFNLVILVVLGLALTVSVALSSARRSVLELVGLGDSSIVALTVVRPLLIGVAIAADTFIFLVIFSRLSGAKEPWQAFLRGAFFAALGFGALKLLAAFLLGRVTQNPVYAGFAVLIGLAVWINLVSRWTLFAAAWTATSTKGPAPAPTPAPFPQPG